MWLNLGLAGADVSGSPAANLSDGVTGGAVPLDAQVQEVLKQSR
jgi:hypothetical protein